MPARLLRSFVPALLAVACGAQVDPRIIRPDEKGKGNETVCDPAKYPCAPYGYLPGSVIENLSIPARRDLDLDGSIGNEVTRNISLSDYFQNKDYKVLVITSSAEWCDPCKAEQPGLVRLYNDYKGNLGGQVAILEVIVQDNDGVEADMTVAERWSTAHGLPFDIGVDPHQFLAPYYDINAFPMNLVIRTSDMQIVYQKNGMAENELRAAVEQALLQ